jgi:transposase
MVEQRVYSEEFKREAVRLAQERGNRAGVARELGLSDTVLSRWMKRLSEGGEDETAFPGRGNTRDAEVARLKRELARALKENEILKKAVGIFTSRPK